MQDGTCNHDRNHDHEHNHKATCLANHIRNSLKSKAKIESDEMKKAYVFCMLIKDKSHKGLKYHYGLKVREQHTNSTGRKGRILGVQRKK